MKNNLYAVKPVEIYPAGYTIEITSIDYEDNEGIRNEFISRIDTKDFKLVEEIYNFCEFCKDLTGNKWRGLHFEEIYKLTDLPNHLNNFPLIWEYYEIPETEKPVEAFLTIIVDLFGDSEYALKIVTDVRVLNFPKEVVAFEVLMNLPTNGFSD